MEWSKDPQAADPSLKFIKVRRSECTLGAICTALELDYEAVSDRFTRENGVGFGECAEKRLKIPKLLAFLEEVWGGPTPWFSYSRPMPDRKRTWEVNPYLEGIGVLTYMDGNNKGRRHTIAFENGWIYDGNAPGPLPYWQWSIEVGDNIILDGFELRKENEEK